VVLEAHEAALAAVAPGNGWIQPHDAAIRSVTRGLKKIGLLEGSVPALIRSRAYQKFFMHRTGHWLGMDVHDAGDYKRNGAWLLLKPGMVLTVEPGCYVRPAEGVPERFWNIGVRIEDDALVTDSGCEIITAAAPKNVDDIELLMRG